MSSAQKRIDFQKRFMSFSFREKVGGPCGPPEVNLDLTSEMLAKS